MTIDEKGDVYISGNLEVAGIVNSQSLIVNREATVSGSLFANLIKPLPNKDLTIQLTSRQASGSGTISNQQLAINNQFGHEVASIDASGSARFNKLLIAGASEASPSGTGFSRLFETRVKSSATAGTATLPAGEILLIIENPQLTEKSLVYVTPTSDAQNQVLYVKSKSISNQQSAINDQSYFTVAINKSINKPVTFNWWVIN